MIELDSNAERELLATTAERFVARRWPMSHVRALADGKPALADGYSREIAELGWLAMFVPVEDGGGSVSDDPVGEAVVLAEIRGRSLQPEPFISANIAAALLSRAGDAGHMRQHLASNAAGESITTVVLGGDGLWDADGVDARPEHTGWRLNGEVIAAGHGDVESLLVLGWTGVATSAFLVQTSAEGVDVEPLAGLDPSQAVSRVRLRNVRVEALDRVTITAADLSYSRGLGSCLAVAETIGAMTALFALTRQYALDRLAFGRPIGSFQAVKHLLADLSVVLECSNALAAAAARALREEAPHAEEVAAMAKVFVGERATEFAQGCLQVHGGIGFAWEHDLHLYMRRIAANRALYGAPEHLRQRIMGWHEHEFAAT